MNKKERRVVNFSKQDFDIIKTYCEEHTLDMPKWITQVLLNEIGEYIHIISYNNDIKSRLNTLFNEVLKLSITEIRKKLEENNELFFRVGVKNQHGVVSLTPIDVVEIITKTSKDRKTIYKTKYGNTFENYEVIHFNRIKIRNIERCIIGQLSKIAILDLFSNGFKESDLVDFSINILNFPPS